MQYASPASYEQIIVENIDFPIMVLENERQTTYHHMMCSLHWHEQLEIHYILEGSLEIWINQTQHIVHSGDLLVVNSNDTHSTYCNGRLKELILIFRLEDISMQLASVNPVFQTTIHVKQISDLMLAFNEEYIRKDVGFHAACKALIMQLMVYLCRNHMESEISRLIHHRHAQQLQRLLPVLEYIEEHYAEPISSETLANLIYVSKDRFNHLFKESVGIPLRKHINEVRLQVALNLLRKGLCTPAEAAARVGFTDYNHFGRLFRKSFACSPSFVVPKSSKAV